MDKQIIEIAERIKTIREILEMSTEEMAKALNITESNYVLHESGGTDFSFTFLYKCANIFGIDIVELVTGEDPKLSFYSVVRQGKGLPIKRYGGFTYQHLAYLFKHKKAEPFLVTAPYSDDEQDKDIPLACHKGQEFDYIISGSLKVAMEDHIEILNAGDAIYYDSAHNHGMIATGGEECVFIAVVIGKLEEEEQDEKPVE